jgi:hypothetical protein
MSVKNRNLDAPFKKQQREQPIYLEMLSNAASNDIAAVSNISIFLTTELHCMQLYILEGVNECTECRYQRMCV